MPDRTQNAPPPHGTLRQSLAFAAVGVAALLIDAAVLTALTAWAELPALLARIPSIAIAMICAWALNRTLTFANGTAPSITEFGRYATVAAGAALVNYGVFTMILLLRPGTPALYALCISSAIAAVLSYSGYRWFVFQPNERPGKP